MRRPKPSGRLRSWLREQSTRASAAQSQMDAGSDCSLFSLSVSSTSPSSCASSSGIALIEFCEASRVESLPPSAKRSVGSSLSPRPLNSSRVPAP